MLPPVGQIIFVDPRFFAAEVEVTESYLMWVVVEAYSPWFPYPIGFASNEELMQVLIGPAECDLKCVVELGNGAVAAHEQATPDLGTNLAYPDAQLIHLHCLICAAHALPLLKYSLSRVYRYRLRKESRMVLS